MLRNMNVLKLVLLARLSYVELTKVAEDPVDACKMMMSGCSSFTTAKSSAPSSRFSIDLAAL